MTHSPQDHGWFILYHKYTHSRSLDRTALKQFRDDCRIMKRLGVRHLIIEDYPAGLHYGAYTRVWSKAMLKAMVATAHESGINTVCYINPAEVSTAVVAKHPDWATVVGGKPSLAFSTQGVKSCYWRGFPMQTQICCPTTGWADDLVAQVDELLETCGFDGIYLDRAYWVWPCDEHSFVHNCAAMAALIGRLAEAVRRRKGTTIISDYYICQPVPLRFLGPDHRSDLRDVHRRTGERILKLADIFLAENCLETEMTGVARRRISELHRRFPRTPLMVFSHWDECRGVTYLRASVETAAKAGESFCYFFPFPIAETLRETGQALAWLLAGQPAGQTQYPLV